MPQNARLEILPTVTATFGPLRATGAWVPRKSEVTRMGYARATRGHSTAIRLDDGDRLGATVSLWSREENLDGTSTPPSGITPVLAAKQTYERVRARAQR